MPSSIKRQVEGAKEKASPLLVQGSQGNTLTINDAQGQRMLEAQVEKFEGIVQPGAGIQGPVKFQKAKCKLFQAGKPQWNMVAPEAVWDGKQLVTNKTAHAVSADEKTVLDARTAVWTATTAQMSLQDAKLQQMKQGRVDFTAEGPKAEVADQVVHMGAGATAHNAGGQQLKADRVHWHLPTGKLEADGHVQILDAGMEVSGQRLKADTKLRRGRLSGGTRVHLKRMPKAKKAG
jgi:hypothetical protein